MIHGMSFASLVLMTLCASPALTLVLVAATLATLLTDAGDMRAGAATTHPTVPARTTHRVAEAHDRLAHLNAALAPLTDPAVRASAVALDRAIAPLLAALERCPAHHPALRDHLTLYLDGATDAARRHTERQANGTDAAHRAAFIRFVVDLEQSYIRAATAVGSRPIARMGWIPFPKRGLFVARSPRST